MNDPPLCRTHLENFRDITRTVMNVIAMSIGKFNFGAIKDANMLAAVIFFVFSIVVNMVGLTRVVDSS